MRIMHIDLQGDLYLFQVNRIDFQPRRNREDATPVNKTTNNKKEQDFSQLFQNQLNQSTI